VEREEKAVAAPMVADGRVEELKHLEAGERALAAAYAEHVRVTAAKGGVGRIGERHAAHAARLVARIRELGGTPLDDADADWIAGPVDLVATLAYAEHAAARAYHDHLLDLDPESMMLVRDHILPDHEQALVELTGERVPSGFSLEP
jgi:hypothetical protein